MKMYEFLLPDSELFSRTFREPFMKFKFKGFQGPLEVIVLFIIQLLFKFHWGIYNNKRSKQKHKLGSFACYSWMK